MRNLFIAAIAALTITPAFAATCVKQTVSALPQTANVCPASGCSTDQARTRLIELINAARKDPTTACSVYGVDIATIASSFAPNNAPSISPPLPEIASLDQMALAQATYLSTITTNAAAASGYHVDGQGRNATQRFALNPSPWTYGNEDAAVFTTSLTDTDIQSVVRAWLASADHMPAIFNQAADGIGVSFVKGQNDPVYRIIADFGDRSYTPNQQIPQTGWYYDPTSSATDAGHGFAIQSTDSGHTFFATYEYDVTGNPIWYVAILDPDSKGWLTGSLLTAINGAPFAQVVNQQNLTEQNLGTISIKAFDNGSTQDIFVDWSNVKPSNRISGGHITDTVLSTYWFNYNVSNGRNPQSLTHFGFSPGYQPHQVAPNQTKLMNGWYAASNTDGSNIEAGRGFFAEVQGTNIFVGYFAYDPSSGQPMWLYGPGQQVPTTDGKVTFSIPMSVSKNHGAIAYQYANLQLTVQANGNLQASFTSGDGSWVKNLAPFTQY